MSFEPSPFATAEGSSKVGFRADPFADGLKPTDSVFLRDGSTCGQAEAGERIALNPALLYATRDEAVHDGLARLREAAARES